MNFINREKELESLNKEYKKRIVLLFYTEEEESERQL